MDAGQDNPLGESDVSLLLALSSNKQTVDTSKKPPQKRASKACLACRARKVRCDATVRGTPCTNCRLDNGECIVSGRPTKYRKMNKEGELRAPAPEPHTPLLNHPAAAANRNTTRSNQVDKWTMNDYNQSGTAIEVHSPPVHKDTSQAPFAGSSTQQDRYCQETPRAGTLAQGHGHPTSNDFPYSHSKYRQSRWLEEQPQVDTTLDQGHWPEAPPQIGTAITQHESSGTSLRSSMFKHAVSHTLDGIGNSQVSHNGCVPFSQYHFIRSDNFSHVSEDDIKFLKSQGAFQLPGMPALDEFVQEYFRHVHPHLPLIDEAIFWDLFCGHKHGTRDDCRISIFTFQAMLFACSSFVSVETLQAAGFRSIRHARATLYRRAKLLFDLDGKRDHISTSQGALLLTYSPDNHNRKLNTYWLGVGIRFAKDGNAHRYNSSPEVTPGCRNILKRLWWCCVLRDRILPLGVRRPLYITNDHFDFKTNQPLTAEDLASEIDNSKVYDSDTKRSLAELLAVLCELAIILTDIIMVVYPVCETPFSTTADMVLSQVRVGIDRCRFDLDKWYDGTSVQFPTPAGLGDSSASVILFTNLMYIYYHTARIALCHHEVLLSEMAPNPNAYPVQLHRSKEELQESVACMTDIMKELLQLKLLKYMPLSMVAYAALPLVLHVLDVKLSSTRSQCAIKQRRLQIFMEAMQVLQSQYDGTDRVSDYIEKLIRYLATGNPIKPTTMSCNERYNAGGNHIQPSAIPEKSGPIINDWSDVFLRRTNCYLRIVTTVDLSFSRGEFPQESDFPAILNSSKLSAILPLYRMDIDTFKNKDSNRPDHTPRTNGRQEKPNANGAEPISSVLYHPAPYPAAPASQVNISGHFEQPFHNNIEFTDPDTNEHAYNDFDIDSWIYDVLPTFT